RDPDGLRVQELADAEAAQFAAVAGTLDAAERQARVGTHGGIDEYASRLERAHQFASRSKVGRPHARAEAVARAVRERDRLPRVACARHGRERAERLLVERGHPGLATGAERGREVIPLAI